MFFNQLEKRCKQCQIKLTPLVLSIGISKGNISKWRNGTIPTGDILIKLADALDCSVDYLLGRTDVIEVNTKEKPLSIAEQFRELDTSQVAAYGENEFINDNVSIEGLIQILEKYQNQDIEIMTHPGNCDLELYQKSSYSLDRVKELSILCSPGIKKYIKDKDITITNYIQN